MVQVEGHTVHPLELGAGWQLQLGVAPLQQLVVVLDAPLVVPLNEGHLEGALSLVNDRQMLAVVLHNLHNRHGFCILEKEEKIYAPVGVFIGRSGKMVSTWLQLYVPPPTPLPGELCLGGRK